MPAAPAAPAASSKSRFLHNVIWGWTGVGVNIVIGLLLAPIIIERLGKEQYGLWVLLFSAVEYFRMLDFGFRAAAVNACARCLARDDLDGVNRTAATAVVYFVAAAALSITAVMVFREPLLNALNVDGAVRPMARFLLLLIALSVGVRLVLSPLTAVLEAFQRFDLANRAYVGGLVLRSVSSLTVLLLGYGLVAMAYAYLAAQILESLWTIIYVRRLVPRFSVSPAIVDRATLGGLFQFGRYSALMAAANLVSIQAPVTVLSILRGPVEVGLFSFPFRLLMYSAEGLAKVSDVTSSVTAGLDETQRADKVWMLAVTVNRTCLMLFLPGAIFLLLFGRQLLEVWTPQIAADSAPLIPIFLIMFTFAVAGQYNAGAILIGQGKHSAYAYGVVVEVIASVIGMLLLVPHYGIIGAAWAVSLTFVTVRGLWVAILVCRQNGFPLATYLAAIYARPLLLAIPVAALMWWLRGVVFETSTWPHVILAAALTATVYFVAAWFVVLDAGVRQTVTGQLRRLTMR
jgi:O-antigen/teichoic acid export membrane protein